MFFYIGYYFSVYKKVYYWWFNLILAYLCVKPQRRSNGIYTEGKKNITGNRRNKQSQMWSCTYWASQYRKNICDWII